MLAKYFLIIRNYVLSVSSQRKYKFYHHNTILNAFRTNSRIIIGRNHSMVIPLLANQDLTPMLSSMLSATSVAQESFIVKSYDETFLQRATSSSQHDVQAIQTV